MKHSLQFFPIGLSAKQRAERLSHWLFCSGFGGLILALIVLAFLIAHGAQESWAGLIWAVLLMVNMWIMVAGFGKALDTCHMKSG